MDKFIVNKEGWYSFISTTKPPRLEYFYVGDVIVSHGVEIEFFSYKTNLPQQEYYID